MSQIHKLETFFVPHTIKTNMQACLMKHVENNLIQEGDLIEKGVYLRFWLSWEGLLERGLIREGA